MDLQVGYFVIGAIGALAPEIVRLYRIATGGKEGFTWSWFYIVMSIAFACLGGLVAVLLPSENVRAAFFAGISTPVLISTATRKARELAVRKKKEQNELSVQRRSRFDSFFDAL